MRITHEGPGPNTRNLFKQQPTGPQFGFGTAKRMPTRNANVPGPGQYRIPTQVAKVPQYSIQQSDSYKFV